MAAILPVRRRHLAAQAAALRPYNWSMRSAFTPLTPPNPAALAMPNPMRGTPNFDISVG
jgi:hypothetical protein